MKERKESMLEDSDNREFDATQKQDNMREVLARRGRKRSDQKKKISKKKVQEMIEGVK